MELLNSCLNSYIVNSHTMTIKESIFLITERKQMITLIKLVTLVPPLSYKHVSAQSTTTGNSPIPTLLNLSQFFVVILGTRVVHENTNMCFLKPLFSPQFLLILMKLWKKNVKKFNSCINPTQIKLFLSTLWPDLTFN